MNVKQNMMKNEEKASELAERYTRCYNKEVQEEEQDRFSSFPECRTVALAMAEWKDEQLKKMLLEKYRKYATACSIELQKGLTTDAIMYDKMQCMLLETINQFFDGK